MSKNLLLEIGTEEMPANIMSGVVDQLKALAASQFEAHRIAAESITIYATPRRLAVLVKDAADRQPDEKSRNAAHPSKLLSMLMEIRHVLPRDLPADSTSIHLNSSKKGNTPGRMSYMRARKSKTSFQNSSSLSSPA